MDLLELRKQIDEIDSQVVELYERRMEVSRKVAEYKIETGKRCLTGRENRRSWRR